MAYVKENSQVELIRNRESYSEGDSNLRKENQCRNCHAKLDEKDKYCKKCGTRRGEGKFKSHDNIMQCLYGPKPVEREYICKQCGYTWSNVQMISESQYCPRCGTDKIVDKAMNETKSLKSYGIKSFRKITAYIKNKIYK